MDPISNPYAPGAGSQPPELAGRDDILQRTRITLGRVQRGKHAKSFILVGLRGVGKTVLLNKVQEIATNDGFIAHVVETPENKSLPALLIPCLRRILLAMDTKERAHEFVKRGIMTLKSFINSVKITSGEFELGIGVDPAIGIADTGDLEHDLPDLFEAVGLAAKSRSKAIAIILDEMQYLNEAEFSALIMAVHRVSQKQLPLVVVGAGLPQLVGLAGKSKSYAERLFDYPVVDALSLEDAAIALSEPAKREGVVFSERATARIFKHTRGYPYYIQEFGYHTWNYAKQSPILTQDVDAAVSIANKSLDESFFRVRFDRITPREKDYMFGMAQLGPGPHRSGDVAGKLDVSVESIAPVRSSLIKKGMIWSPAHGDTAFTVPMFNEYLSRVMEKK